MSCVTVPDSSQTRVPSMGLPVSVVPSGQPKSGWLGELTLPARVQPSAQLSAPKAPMKSVTSKNGSFCATVETEPPSVETSVAPAR